MSIRAWITDDTSPEHLEVHQVRRYTDDIVLVYQNEQLISITGYRTRVIQLPQQIKDVDREVLSTIFSLRALEADLHLNGYFRLSSQEWVQLKKEIIQRNPNLKGIIKLLEDAQMKHARLSGDDAFAYDALWTTTRMFHRANRQLRQEVFESLREARQTASSARASQSGVDAIEQMIQTLEMASYFRAVNEAEDETYSFVEDVFEKAKRSRSEPKPPRSEEDVIRGDATEFIDWEADRTYFENEEWNRHAIRMIDQQSKRELFIFMAHRKGKGKGGSKSKDAAGADLIYASRDAKSFVLVQYKILKLQSEHPKPGEKVEEKLQLHGKDYKQLEELLTLCDDMQQCLHIQSRDPLISYAPSHAIRLANCPVFYKLIGHNHDLLPSKNFIEGDYVQACYIRSLMDEKGQKTLKFPDDIQRTIGHVEFTALTGNAHLGCRADVYSEMFQHIHKALPSGIVILAMEEKLPSDA